MGSNDAITSQIRDEAAGFLLGGLPRGSQVRGLVLESSFFRARSQLVGDRDTEVPFYCPITGIAHCALVNPYLRMRDAMACIKTHLVSISI